MQGWLYFKHYYVPYVKNYELSLETFLPLCVNMYSTYVSSSYYRELWT